MKKVMTIIALVLFTSAVYANPVDDISKNVSNWMANEKVKTIEYQKNQWASAKIQWLNLLNKFGLSKEDKE